MTRHNSLVSVTFLVFVSTVLAQDRPPKAPVHEVTDTYFGAKIVDPYRWMEDAKSPETANWMKGQADYSRSYLDRLPLRAELLKRFEELSETGVRVSGVQRAGNFYFYYRLAPGENDRRLYVREGFKGVQAASTSGKPILLRVDYDAGHGFGSTKRQRNEQNADIYAFLFQQVGSK